MIDDEMEELLLFSLSVVNVTNLSGLRLIRIQIRIQIRLGFYLVLLFPNHYNTT